MKAILEIREELDVARDFVHCAFLAAQKLQGRDAGAVGTVLFDANDKLREIDDSLAEIDGATPTTSAAQ
jgi:hypothetical protein